ncbi:hypothetical protein LPJ75_001996 [Coemansia sp. RSA 2598]|nr:hypothetical protein LPJ75_001996 [Coemansia sp. RSA 2598]
MLAQKETEIAANLEGLLESLVVISGPCSALPDRCTRRRLATSAAEMYRPVVEVHDAAERLYTKNGLPLFEILDDAGRRDDADSSDGPAAAVLRRRRQSRRAAGMLRSDEPPEDLSDAHYRQLHRKPEYLEKRVRNRELELYQYARWRETQQRREPLDAKADAHKQPKHEPKHEPEPEPEPDKEELELERDRKRARAVRSNELKGLVDSPGFAKAQEKAATASPAPSGADGAPGGPHEGGGSGSVSGNGNSNSNGDGSGSSNGNANGRSSSDVARALSPAERRAAHLGGFVLEQLLALAARLPVCEDSATGAASDSDADSEQASEPQERASSASSSSLASSLSLSPVAAAGGSEAAGGPSGCCCPREFALPPRLYGHMMKQRGRE